MSKTKRYFWLKLKEDFFNQKEIKLLRKIAGGDTYTIIYLKLLLLSLKNDGKIYFDGLTDEFSEEIALEIDESVENVTVTLQFLQKKGLIAFDNDHQDEFELTNIASMIGSETEDARRKRKQRQRQPNKLGQSRDNVPQVSHLGHTEIEIEKELDLEKELEQEKPPSPSREKDISKLLMKIAHIPRLQNNNTIDFLTQDYDYFGYEVCNHVIDLFLKSGRDYYGYMGTIYSRYRRQGIKTLEQVLQDEQKFEQRKTSSSNQQSKKQPAQVTGKTYADFYNEEEIKKFAEMSGESYESIANRRID